MDPCSREPLRSVYVLFTSTFAFRRRFRRGCIVLAIIAFVKYDEFEAKLSGQYRTLNRNRKARVESKPRVETDPLE